MNEHAEAKAKIPADKIAAVAHAFFLRSLSLKL